MAAFVKSYRVRRPSFGSCRLRNLRWVPLTLSLWSAKPLLFLSFDRKNLVNSSESFSSFPLIIQTSRTPLAISPSLRSSKPLELLCLILFLPFDHPNLANSSVLFSSFPSIIQTSRTPLILNSAWLPIARPVNVDSLTLPYNDSLLTKQSLLHYSNPWSEPSGHGGAPYGGLPPTTVGPEECGASSFGQCDQWTVT